MPLPSWPSGTIGPRRRPDGDEAGQLFMAASIIDREAASRLGLFSRLGSNSVQNRHFALSDR